MSNVTQQIKDRLGITDVVSSYIKLEKSGKNLKARCPFHNEKSASFYVSPERESYYCFGCGEHGDIFTFVEKIEGVDFMGALKTLASRAGIELSKDAFKKNEADQTLYHILEDAVSFFEKTLQQTPSAHTYLAQRGITDKTIASFQIGFAPASWRTLHDYLVARGHTKSNIEKVGLIKRKQDDATKTPGQDYYDTFRSRIMFPIFDPSGRPIAFSGRHFGEESPEAPKYINSPETPLFKKGNVLYGFEKAKTGIRKYNFSILVEGPIDLIMAHQYGFTNTVAVMGTALTQEHIERVKRLSRNIVVALDGDSAGIQSALKTSRRAIEADMDVKCAVLPEGSDPADVLKTNPDIWKKAVREAMHVVLFLVEQIQRSHKGDERAFKQKIRNDVLPYVALIQNKIDQKHFIDIVAGHVGVDSAVIEEEMQKVAFQDTLNTSEAPHTPTQHHTFEGRKDVLLRQLIAIIFTQKHRGKEAESHATQERVRTMLGRDPLEGSDESEYQEDMFQLEKAEAEFGDIEVHVGEMLLALQEELLKDSYARAREKLIEAERFGDESRMTELLHECMTISKSLRDSRIKNIH
jgi:DNA primase